VHKGYANGTIPPSETGDREKGWWSWGIEFVQVEKPLRVADLIPQVAEIYSNGGSASIGMYCTSCTRTRTALVETGQYGGEAIARLFNRHKSE
jgi:hypothetical protein